MLRKYFEQGNNISEYSEGNSVNKDESSSNKNPHSVSHIPQTIIISTTLASTIISGCIRLTHRIIRVNSPEVDKTKSDTLSSNSDTNEGAGSTISSYGKQVYIEDISSSLERVTIENIISPTAKEIIEEQESYIAVSDGSETYNVENTVGYESYELFNIPNDTHKHPELFNKDIVITIDDCYSDEHTKNLFTSLESRGLKGTFFPNTNYLNINNPETIALWREIYYSGHEIGYHTTDHLANKSVISLQQDFQKFEEIFRIILGDPEFSIKVVRAPYGAWDTNWTHWVEQNNLLNVRWTLDPYVETKYIESTWNQGYSSIIILHSRQGDAQWLENSVDELVKFTDENGSIVGSVYESIKNNQ